MLKLSLELFSELIHHFLMQRYVVFFRPGRRGIPCISRNAVKRGKNCLPFNLFSWQLDVFWLASLNCLSPSRRTLLTYKKCAGAWKALKWWLEVKVGKPRGQLMHSERVTNYLSQNLKAWGPKPTQTTLNMDAISLMKEKNRSNAIRRSLVLIAICSTW